MLYDVDKCIITFNNFNKKGIKFTDCVPLKAGSNQLTRKTNRFDDKSIKISDINFMHEAYHEY